MRQITSVFIATLLVAACNSSSSYGPTGTTIGVGAVTVGNDVFTPATVRPDTAGVVVWTWNPGGVVHHIVFEDTTIAGSGDMSTGSISRTFHTNGLYPFRCTIHSTAFGNGMHGTVVVGVAAPPDTSTGGGYGY